MTPEQYYETLTFGLTLAGVGMTVVFVALILITLIVAAFPRIDQLIHRSEAKPEAVPEAPAVEEVPLALAASDGDDISPEIIAVISAAVNEVITKKVVVKRVQYRRQPVASAWQVQGRATVMGSNVER